MFRNMIQNKVGGYVREMRQMMDELLDLMQQQERYQAQGNQEMATQMFARSKNQAQKMSAYFSEVAQSFGL